MSQRAQQGRDAIGRYHLRVRNKELLETVDLRAGAVKTEGGPRAAEASDLGAMMHTLGLIASPS